jgi:hypothetical protein
MKKKRFFNSWFWRFKSITPASVGFAEDLMADGRGQSTCGRKDHMLK